MSMSFSQAIRHTFLTHSFFIFFGGGVVAVTLLFLTLAQTL